MKYTKLFLFTIIILGGVLRFFGIFNNLWLDEIWSIQAVSSLSSVSNLASASLLDGHSSLYTLIIFALKDYTPDFLIRLPALIAALGSLFVFLKISKGTYTKEQLIACLLFSISYVSVLYGTEARGYSFLIFFSLLSFYFLQILHRTISSITLICFWFSAILAFFSHFTALQFYLSLLLWSLFYFYRHKRSQTIFLALAIHGIPTIIFSLTYFYYIKNLTGATGPIGSHLEVFINTINLSVGGNLLSPNNPALGLFSLFLFLSLLVILIKEIIQTAKDKNDQWIFYAGILFIFPLCFVLFLKPKVLLERYFLLSIIFCIPLYASFLARQLNSNKPAKAFAYLALVFVAFGNASHFYYFYEHGRGEYQKAIVYILNNSKQKNITISSDHDFRNQMLIDYFYKKVSSNEKEIKYLKTSEPSQQKIDWYLTHSQDLFFKPQKELNVSNTKYKLIKAFPSSALSGWSWFLYRSDQVLKESDLIPDQSGSPDI